MVRKYTTYKSYKKFGFMIVKNIFTESEAKELSFNLANYMDEKNGKSLESERKNSRVYPSNVIKYFPKILKCQINKNLIESLKKIFPSKPSYVNSFQLYFNVHSAGWHIDSQSQLRHKEYNNNLSIKKYKLAKVGIYLTKVPKGYNLPSIFVIPRSHRLPLIIHSLLHNFLYRVPYFSNLLNLFSLDLGTYLNPGDGIIFNHHLWHRSTPTNNSRNFHDRDKCVFYFEAGENETTINYLNHNSGRSLFLEDYGDSGELFWCDYLRSGFNGQFKSHINEIESLGITISELKSKEVSDYLEKIYLKKSKK